jgi:hypothetical protein
MRQVSTVADGPAVVRRFQSGAVRYGAHIFDVCIGVLYEAAQVFFGPAQQNIAWPRRFPSLNLRGKLSLRKEL